MQHFREGSLNPSINTIRRLQDKTSTVTISLSDELNIAVGCYDLALVDHPYIFGDEFTGADIMLAVSLLSMKVMKLLASISILWLISAAYKPVPRLFMLFKINANHH